MTHILITGASSGIGESLALHYAKTGVTLSLCARNEERLLEVTRRCQDKGATVHPRIMNVTDKDAMSEWIIAADKSLPLTLVIANAGIGLNARGYKAAEETFDVNIHGVVNTIHPILPRMEKRRTGQIALVSSMAGYVGLPSAPPYSASKNFVRAYGEALRGQLAPLGVKINVICPGFVRSRLTERNRFKMPFLMDAPQAARVIADGLTRNKGRIAFPWPMMVMVRTLTLLPYPLYEWISRRLPDKA